MCCSRSYLESVSETQHLHTLVSWNHSYSFSETEKYVQDFFGPRFLLSLWLHQPITFQYFVCGSSLDRLQPWGLLLEMDALYTFPHFIFFFSSRCFPLIHSIASQNNCSVSATQLTMQKFFFFQENFGCIFFSYSMVGVVLRIIFFSTQKHPMNPELEFFSHRGSISLYHFEESANNRILCNNM